MLNITTTKEASTVFITLDGRLDTTTAQSLENEIRDKLGNASELIFDFAKLEYVSSAGLRVLLATQKTMNKQGSMCIKNVAPAVKDIFEVTGFADIISIV